MSRRILLKKQPDFAEDILRGRGRLPEAAEMRLICIIYDLYAPASHARKIRHSPGYQGGALLCQGLAEDGTPGPGGGTEPLAGKGDLPA